MTYEELNKQLESAGYQLPGAATTERKAFHQALQSTALVQIIGLLQAGASTGRQSAGKQAAQSVAVIRKSALEALAPFYRAMKANEAGGQKLKPEDVVMQIGAIKITGEDIKNAADTYEALWASR